MFSAVAGWWMFATAMASPVHMVAWNLESGGAELERHLAVVKNHPEVDVWALSEVASPGWASTISESAGSHFAFELGTTGNDDRLAIVYDTTDFERVERFELLDIRPEGYGPSAYRAPLGLKLRHKPTGTSMLVVANHLNRGNAEGRRRQARELVRWAGDQALPVVLLGDFNLDYRVTPRAGTRPFNRAFEVFRDAEHLKWVRPDDEVPTNCSRHRSILDFVFVNDAASAWSPTSTIWEKGDGFCQDAANSDHRPVAVRFELPKPVSDAPWWQFWR